MNQLKVKRLHPDAKLPTKAHATDAGWDIYYCGKHAFLKSGTEIVSTGLAVEIPSGYYGHMRPRSSQFANGVEVSGVIDSGFRGELRVMMQVSSLATGTVLNPGDRIAQMLLLPVPEFEVVEVDELSETPRGSGGFGSSGR